MGSDQIVKGERAKRRRRSSSPFGLAAVTVSSSSIGYYYSGDDDDDDCCNYYYYYNNNNNNNNNSISFPTTSGEIYESTEEDEDMANCLIMLAQGDRRRPRSSSHEKSTAKTGLLCVYDCKTCNRSFPSFQALGGHRASHKKLKAIQEPDEKSPPPPPPPPPPPSSSSSVVADDSSHHHHHHHKSNKIHECSICGSEFTSGQALGGHMRRHRAAVAGNITNHNQRVAIHESNTGDHLKPAADATRRNILPLDLNLPAPEDDHHLRFGTTQQSSSLVFSAPALVDCHY